MYLSTALGNNSHKLDTLQELVRVHIPVVMAYRYDVDERIAERFTYAFYSELWTTFSPQQALHVARREVAHNHNDILPDAAILDTPFMILHDFI